MIEPLDDGVLDKACGGVLGIHQDALSGHSKSGGRTLGAVLSEALQRRLSLYGPINGG
jgi:hypothetical protein